MERCGFMRVHYQIAMAAETYRRSGWSRRRRCCVSCHRISHAKACISLHKQKKQKKKKENKIGFNMQGELGAKALQINNSKKG